MADVLTLRHGEESLQILLNGEELGYYNHDEDGWQGMEAVQMLAEKLALRFGALLVHEEGEEE
jgi:hypothetical protein